MSAEFLNECFRAGGIARVASQALGANPYKFDTPEYGSWCEGWLDMDEHLASRDVALAGIR